MANITHSIELPFSVWSEDGVLVSLHFAAQVMTVSGMAYSELAGGSAVSVKLKRGAKPLVTAYGVAPDDDDPVPVLGSDTTDLPAGTHRLKLQEGNGTDVDPLVSFIVTIVELDPMGLGKKKRKPRSKR